MDRIFRVDFYPHEFLTLTAHMNPEQKGIFMTICSLIYAHRGAIKEDYAWIARMANCSPRLVRSVVAQLTPLDLQVQDGFVSQKRCELELNKKRTHLEVSTNAGRISAELRRESNENKGVGKNSVGSSVPTSSPSPSLTEKENPSSDDAGSLFAGDGSEAPDPAASAMKGIQYSEQFEAFWLQYPPERRREKPAAFAEWKKARGVAKFEDIMAGLADYKKTRQCREGFSPYPAKWLKGQRWAEEHSSDMGAAPQPAGYRNQKPTIAKTGVETV